MSEGPLTDAELLEMPLTEHELDEVAKGGNVVRPSNNIGPMAVQRMVAEIRRHRRVREITIELAEHSQAKSKRAIALLEELIERQRHVRMEEP